MAAPPKKAFPLRLDPALYAAIERAAAADLRSVNAQVECLLREALARGGGWGRAPRGPTRGGAGQRCAAAAAEGERGEREREMREREREHADLARVKG